VDVKLENKIEQMCCSSNSTFVLFFRTAKFARKKKTPPPGWETPGESTPHSRHAQSRQLRREDPHPGPTEPPPR